MSGDGLVPPLNAPAAAIPTPGVQPGISGQIILAHYVIIFGTAGGVFIYSGTPANGNPPVAWITSATADPYGNTIQPGIFLAELASSGNALAGLLWNTIVGSEPLLALFPDATVGFSGNSPFILGRVFNRGAVNELLSLAMGGGGTAGTGSPVQVELFSQSKDGTVLGHVSFYDWASTDLICDVNVNGIVAANPSTPNTPESWHTLSISGTGLSAGSPAPAYKLYPDNTVAVAGEVSATSGTTTGTFATLPSVYRPASQKKYAVPVSAGTPPAAANPQVTIQTSGAMILSAGPTASAYSFALDTIRFPLDY